MHIEPRLGVLKFIGMFCFAKFYTEMISLLMNGEDIIFYLNMFIRISSWLLQRFQYNKQNVT